jgi:hypothetical protein
MFFPNGAGVSFNEILRDEQDIDSDINFKRYDEETDTVEIISIPIHKFVAKLEFIKHGEDTWFARKDYGSNSSNEGSNNGGSNNGMSNNGRSYGQQSMADPNGNPSNPNDEMAGGGKRRNARKSKKSRKSRKTKKVRKSRK